MSGGAEGTELKRRVDGLERENKELRRTVFELSSRLSHLQHLLRQAQQRPFDLFKGAPMLHGTPVELCASGDERGKAEVKSLASPILKSRPSFLSQLVESAPQVTELGLEDPLGDFHLGREQQRRSQEVVSELEKLDMSLEVKVHSGAVYALSWAPEGQFLASGSFDKSVVITKVESPAKMGERISSKSSSLPGAVNEEEELEKIVFSAHNQLVSDVKWNCSSERVFSGSFDRTVCIWDAKETRNSPLSQIQMGGMVMSLAADRNQPNLSYVSTIHGDLRIVDERDPLQQTKFTGECDGVVKALYIPLNRQDVLLSGSTNGIIQKWDLRSGKLISPDSILNDPGGRPITSIVTTGTETSAMVAVNSYDNILRVYDERKILQYSLEEAENQPRQVPLIASLTGHRNKNWPIRASFFRARTDVYLNTLKETTERFLLATGSASTSVYVFSFMRGKDAKLLHKLKGHQGRVYACEFTTFTENTPVLASCSADSTIRLWFNKER